VVGVLQVPDDDVKFSIAFMVSAPCGGYPFDAAVHVDGQKIDTCTSSSPPPPPPLPPPTVTLPLASLVQRVRLLIIGGKQSC
jgi:hypothetical protein